MNKKEFKRFMQQGLGRCVLILQASDNIEKYKEIVLWGCLHNLSYDTQSEGTRASYIYKLTTFFNDEEYFVLPTVRAFEHISCRSHWLFMHLCELLQRFAENGNENAQKALKKKYESLLTTLIYKRRFDRYDFERDNYEQICLSLSSISNIENVLHIASDMGRLFKENPHYDGSDFNLFCSSMSDRIGEKRLHSMLKQEAQKSENIHCFFQNFLKSAEDMQGIIRKPIELPSAEDIKIEVVSTGKLSPASRVHFSRNTKNEEKIKLAETALAEPNLERKAEYLSAFAFRDENFPLSHEPIIEYTQSSHPKLSEVAFNVLTHCQSQIVRDYAFKLLADETKKPYALKMLLCNYTSKDKRLLLTELYKIKADYNKGD